MMAAKIALRITEQSVGVPAPFCPVRRSAIFALPHVRRPIWAQPLVRDCCIVDCHMTMTNIDESSMSDGRHTPTVVPGIRVCTRRMGDVP